MSTVPADNRLKQAWQSPFGRGFAAILPLWLAAAPFAFAFVIAARTAGIADGSIQMMSLFMFTSAAQLALVELFAAGASAQGMPISQHKGANAQPNSRCRLSAEPATVT